MHLQLIGRLGNNTDTDWMEEGMGAETDGGPSIYPETDTRMSAVGLFRFRRAAARLKARRLEVLPHMSIPLPWFEFSVMIS